MEVFGAGNPLVDADVAVLLALNGAWPGGDALMWWISQTWTWLPLYALLLWGLKTRFQTWKRWSWALGAIALSLAGTDMGSARIAKPLVERPRPSHEPALAAELHLVTPAGWEGPYRGGAYGFFSSHAANHMGIAVLVGLLLGGGRVLLGLVFWAFLIGYSRIYLGVHYPGDVLAGALWGAAWGGLCWWIWQRIMPLTSPVK
jgi:undecaprenyl-diphosphatase